MEYPQSGELAQREVELDLKAAVQARRELDPQLEDHLIEAFLARIEQRVDARVAQQLSGAVPVRTKVPKNDAIAIPIVAGSFALAIPLVAIAGDIAGGAGVFFVMLAVVAVNLLYFIDRWV